MFGSCARNPAIAAITFSLVKYTPGLLCPAIFRLFLLCALGTAAVTVKLSGLPLAIVGGLVAFIMLIKKIAPRPEMKSMARHVLALASLPCLGFLARNVVLSGWLLYPVPIGNMQLAWSAPRPEVIYGAGPH